MTTLNALKHTLDRLSQKDQEKVLKFASSLLPDEEKKKLTPSLMRYAGQLHTDDPTFADNASIDADIASDAMAESGKGN